MYIRDPLRQGHRNPLEYSCLENLVDRRAWQATVHGVARVGHDLATKPPPPLRQKSKALSPACLECIHPCPPCAEMRSLLGMCGNYQPQRFPCALALPHLYASQWLKQIVSKHGPVIWNQVPNDKTVAPVSSL